MLILSNPAQRNVKAHALVPAGVINLLSAPGPVGLLNVFNALEVGFIEVIIFSTQRVCFNVKIVQSNCQVAYMW